MDKLSELQRSSGTLETHAPRLIEIDSAAVLQRTDLTPALLREAAVVVRSAALRQQASLDVVAHLFGWMQVWRDHPSYASGVWTCTVDAENQIPQYTAYKPDLLDFHTDMTRYVSPPEFTIIRCVRPAARGGENSVIHVDDIVPWLAYLGEGEIVRTLARFHRLNTDTRHRNTAESASADHGISAPILVAGQPRTPTRIFDHEAATKAQHLDLLPEEMEHYAQFKKILRAGSAELAETVLLGSGDLLAFSNWRMLHARAACFGSGRVTDIIMGNLA